MTLEAEEIERYARHLVLPEIGGAGQQKLKNARVLVIGAGGLGAPVLMYLAAAGIGTLGIVDDDVVSLSNLQRQIIHDTERVGAKKTESARAAIARINPHVTVEAHDTRLTPGNAARLVRGHDVVVDGSDNFATRYAVADACESEKVALVTGAVGRFDGSVTTLMPFREKGGRKLPSYRDLFPEAPPEGTVPSCAEAGILGALTGVVGSIQAMEAIKLVTGTGDVLAGRLLLVDALSMRFETIDFA